MAANHTLTFGDGNFHKAVLESPTPVLVDFWAAWCGPCRVMASTVDSLASDYAGRLAVGTLNVDENPQTAERFGIRSIPTLLLFKDGKVVDSTVGLVDRAQLTKLVEEHVA